MKLIAIISARGGSKGIINKNIKLLNGHPLIYYAINNAKTIGMFDEIVVTSDSDEILNIAQNYGASILKRSNELSQDDITLDPVIYDALTRSEEKNNTRYDIVITLQPTSPLLSHSTLKNAVLKFIEDKISDTYISAVNKPHLAWRSKGSGYIPDYEERLNRQKLPPYYIETGGFLISKRENVSSKSRLGTTVSIYPIPENEAVDIDDMNDWILCETQLSKKKIVFRADAFKELGTGHIYRVMTLYKSMLEHNLTVVLNKNYPMGIDMVEKTKLNYRLIETDDDFFAFLSKEKPDIVVVDCLNTTKNYVVKLKEIVQKVIVFEDEGEGSKYADAVINALYEKDIQEPHKYYGAKYCCLRDEFFIKTPKDFSCKVNNIFVSFGGSDPSDITSKVYEIACRLIKKYPDLTFDFVVGLGFKDERKKELVPIPDKINIIYNTPHISEYMAKSDMAVISAGGTIFEVCSLGVPSIVLTQNLRETSHKFAQIHNGFINLGLGDEIDAKTIFDTIEWLMNAASIRKELQKLMLSADLRNGIKRVKNIILGDYYE
jgi:CMP-N-acetylneuraminic acid synthetase/spore coat polysaccharide biosynthesis predicted glycosyltransferase SpsG